MIGIIGAMDQEIAAFRQALDVVDEREVDGFRFLCGRIGGSAVAILKSGIGKVAAAVGTTVLIREFRPGWVINTGSAGALASGLDIGNCIVGAELVYHDADVSAFGYAPGQIPGMPPRFSSDPSLRRAAEAAAAKLKIPTSVGLIATGDRFVADPEQLATILERFPDCLAVEMEAASIAQTCHLFRLPVLIIRAVSDRADHDSPGDFASNIEIASAASAALVIETVRAS